MTCLVVRSTLNYSRVFVHTQRIEYLFLKRHHTMENSEFKKRFSIFGIKDGTETPVVNLEGRGGGLVEGQYETTTRNKLFASFYGIPFATPPLGELRFRDPIPPKPWTGVYKAESKRDICIQLSRDGIVRGSEDCLYLNIYSPLEAPSKIPVIVYIHGGGHVAGKPPSNIDALLENNVLVVTIAYRLGVLGFLSLDIPEVPGNAALKDQSIALKWIKENIDRFGGDENNITIMGLSAGGSSVSYQQISPMSSGLFHRAIALSSTCLTSWALQRNPQKMVEELASKLNLEVNNKTQLLHDLRNVDITHLVRTSRAVLSDPEGFSEEESPFAPVIERRFEESNSFIDKHPMDYITGRDFSDIPVIYGYASKEYLLFSKEATIHTYVNNNINVVPSRWRDKYPKQTIEKLAKTIKQFYFGKNDNIDLNETTNYLAAIDLFSDITFGLATVETARIHAKNCKSLIYAYVLTFKGSLSNPKLHKYNLEDATHSEDETYLFIEESPRVEDESPEGIVRNRLAKMYTNFALSGNPTPDSNDLLLNTQWLPVTAEACNYLEIGKELLLKKNPIEERRKFWEELTLRLENGEI